MMTMSRTTFVAFMILAGLSVPATAEPNLNTQKEAGVVAHSKAHVSKSSRRHAKARGKRKARRYVEVDAPTTRVKSRRGHVVVNAPFTDVERSSAGVRVRAPFVDIWVPRR